MRKECRRWGRWWGDLMQLRPLLVPGIYPKIKRDEEESQRDLSYSLCSLSEAETGGLAPLSGKAGRGIGSI